MSKTALEDTSRWYCLSREGMATLCTCEEDAKVEAANAQQNYPRNGPHRAAQLVPYADLRALLADRKLGIEVIEGVLKADRDVDGRIMLHGWQVAAIDAALAQMAKGE